MDHTRNATKVDVYQLEGNMTPSCDFHLLYHKLTYFRLFMGGPRNGTYLLWYGDSVQYHIRRFI